MISREVAPRLKKLARQFPVVSVTGPRQSGKTTLIRELFSDYEYFNLENPNTRRLVEADPAQFIHKNRIKVIFDEIQRVPELLSYIQSTVDEINTPGAYVISGSQNLLLSAAVSQSLAGRVAIVNLLPLSITELENHSLASTNAFEQLGKGFYPRIYDQNINITDFYANYVATYIERDVRQLKNIDNLATFQRFMQLVAGRVGQIFVVADIAGDLGIDAKTVRSWLDILEASYIAYRLPPYFKNFGKRIIKSPKIYFYDTGVLSYLLGIDSQAEMETHFARGQLFENLVVSEIKKTIANFGLNFKPYFWRDRNSQEIDLLIDRGGSMDIIEIKSSSTYRQEYTKAFAYWQKLKDAPPGKIIVVYSGDQTEKISHHELVPWRRVSSIIK